MPMLTSDDGVRLHYEEAGSGAPVVFVHEFAGGGYGSHPATHAKFQQDSRANAETIRSKGLAYFVDTYGRGPTRVQLQNKDPRAFDEYLRQFREHSAPGAMNTLLGVQARRPSFYDMTAEIARLQVPLLVLTGDEDEPSIEASLMIKRCAPAAALAVLPRSGHGINLEEPALFNQLLDDFLHQVGTGRWGKR